MDRGVFPTVAEYLDRLPQGCSSYPQCVAKASFLCQSLKDRPIDVARGALPEPVEALIRRPPALTAWIPEVHFNAAMFAMRDIHFPGLHGREEFRRWTYKLAASLFQTTLYRALFFVVSPMRLLRGMESRWHTFHRGGVELHLVEERKTLARIRITYPDFLYVDLGLVGVQTSVQAAVEAAGGREVSVVLARVSDGETDLLTTWR
jgi:hypothetical protein